MSRCADDRELARIITARGAGISIARKHPLPSGTHHYTLPVLDPLLCARLASRDDFDPAIRDREQLSAESPLPRAPLGDGARTTRHVRSRSRTDILRGGLISENWFARRLQRVRSLGNLIASMSPVLQVSTGTGESARLRSSLSLCRLMNSGPKGMCSAARHQLATAAEPHAAADSFSFLRPGTEDIFFVVFFFFCGFDPFRARPPTDPASHACNPSSTATQDMSEWAVPPVRDVRFQIVAREPVKHEVCRCQRLAAAPFGVVEQEHRANARGWPRPDRRKNPTPMPSEASHGKKCELLIRNARILPPGRRMNLTPRNGGNRTQN